MSERRKIEKVKMFVLRRVSGHTITNYAHNTLQIYSSEAGIQGYKNK
jgi:hypothetical protein